MAAQGGRIMWRFSSLTNAVSQAVRRERQTEASALGIRVRLGLTQRPAQLQAEVTAINGARFALWFWPRNPCAVFVRESRARKLITFCPFLWGVIPRPVTTCKGSAVAVMQRKPTVSELTSRGAHKGGARWRCWLAHLWRIKATHPGTRRAWVRQCSRCGRTQIRPSVYAGWVDFDQRAAAEAIRDRDRG